MLRLMTAVLKKDKLQQDQQPTPTTTNVPLLPLGNTTTASNIKSSKSYINPTTSLKHATGAESAHTGATSSSPMNTERRRQVRTITPHQVIVPPSPPSKNQHSATSESSTNQQSLDIEMEPTAVSQSRSLYTIDMNSTFDSTPTTPTPTTTHTYTDLLPSSPTHTTPYITQSEKTAKPVLPLSLQRSTAPHSQSMKNTSPRSNKVVITRYTMYCPHKKIPIRQLPQKNSTIIGHLHSGDTFSAYQKTVSGYFKLVDNKVCIRCCSVYYIYVHLLSIIWYLRANVFQCMPLYV